MYVLISASLKDIQGSFQQGLALLWIKMSKLYLGMEGRDEATLV